MKPAILKYSQEVIVFVFLSIQCFAPLSAQKLDVESVYKNEKPSVHFRVVGYGDSFFEGIKFEVPSKKELRELQFVPNQRSRSYAYPSGSSSLTFFTEENDERGKTHRVKQAAVSFSGNSKELLFVFLSPELSNSELPYEVLVVDESKEKFGAGDLYVLNLCGAPVMVRIGELDIHLSNLSFSEKLSVDLNSKFGHRMQLAVKVQSDWRLVHSSRIRADKYGGLIYVLKPPLEKESLRLRMERL